MSIELTDRKSKFKVVIIGDPRVGKTTIIKKYVRIQIELEYMPTVGASISKQPVKLEFNGVSKYIDLLIWDIAGQKQFDLLHKVYYKGAKGIVLIFDLTNQDSFINLQRWYEELIENQLQNAPLIIVGNKSDLSEEIKINQDSITNLMKNLPNASFYETSAINGQNIDAVFNNLALQIYNQNF